MKGGSDVPGVGAGHPGECSSPSPNKHLFRVFALLDGRLIFIHLQCWQLLPFLTIQRQRCIKILCPKDPEFYTPLPLNCQKGRHLPALEVYKNQSPTGAANAPRLWLHIQCLRTLTTLPKKSCLQARFERATQIRVRNTLTSMIHCVDMCFLIAYFSCVSQSLCMPAVVRSLWCRSLWCIYNPSCVIYSSLGMKIRLGKSLKLGGHFGFQSFHYSLSIKGSLFILIPKIVQDVVIAAFCLLLIWGLQLAISSLSKCDALKPPKSWN